MVKASVCKTVVRRFESDPSLFNIKLIFIKKFGIIYIENMKGKTYINIAIGLTDAELDMIIKQRKHKQKIEDIKNLWNQFEKDLNTLGGRICPDSLKTGYRSSGHMVVKSVNIDPLGNIELQF